MAKMQGINSIIFSVIAVVVILALVMIIGEGVIGQLATELQQSFLAPVDTVTREPVAQLQQQFQFILSGRFVQSAPSLTFPSGVFELACPEIPPNPTCLEDFKKPTIKGDTPDICVSGEPQPEVLNTFLADLAKLQNDCLKAANDLGDQISESRQNVRCWLKSIPVPEEDSFVFKSLCPSVGMTGSLGSMSGIPLSCQDELSNLLREVRNYCDRVESLWHYYNSYCTNIVDCAGLGISSEAERKAFQNTLSAVFRGAKLQLESIQNSDEWLRNLIKGFKCSNLCDEGMFTPSGVIPPGITAPGQFVAQPRVITNR